MKLDFNHATAADLPKIIKMLADDELGQSREDASLPLQSGYTQAFAEISNDPNNELIVGKEGDQVVAVLQITYIPNLTLIGTKRAQIEGVRVAASHRGKGIGRQLINHALERARKNGCKLAQLTTNNARPDAHRFYESLGFKGSHLGFKKPI